MINVFQPQLGQEELEAVRSVFESNWLGKGKRTDEFETQLAERLGVGRKQVRSVSCCTAGMFLVGNLLEWGPGDEVILPTVSFVGAANAVAACGATPVFADVDSRTLNLTSAAFEAVLTAKTKAVLLLHYGGVPCRDIEEIVSVCRSREIAVIEDNACSPFSTIGGRACGTFGDFGVWSFDAMKILVTGDGGLVYARRPEDAERIEKLAYLGLETASGLASASFDRWWEFEISCFGSREIMNDLSSAIGLEQLKKIDRFLARRREIHDYYNDALKGIDGLELPPRIPEAVEPSYYLFWVQTEHRDKLATWLRERGIYTTFRYYPLHLVKHYGSQARLPAAEKAAARTLCLPLHQSLSDADVEQIGNAIREFPDVR